MSDSQGTLNCIYNLVYTQFNQDFGRENLFTYDFQYPSFYNIKNNYFHVDTSILNNINNIIRVDVYSFKSGLLEESEEYNKSALKNALPKRSYKANSYYAVTFNKNHILSTIVTLRANAGDYGPKYYSLDNYNYDLLTGNTITLNDIFNEGIDYIQVITDYVNYKINQNKASYYSDIIIDIQKDQSFYITDDGIIIYFGIDEIAPEELGIPMFKLSFEKFAPYIKPRFYCLGQNLIRKRRFKKF